MIRILASFVGPAIFLGAYVMPMLSMAQNLTQYTHEVKVQVEARTSIDAMLASVGSRRTMEQVILRLPDHAYQARELMEIGMAELDIAIRDGKSLSPLITEQLQRHRDMMELISDFLRRQNGLSR